MVQTPVGTLLKQTFGHFRENFLLLGIHKKVSGNALVIKHFFQDAITIGQMSVCQKTIGQIRDTLVFRGDILGWYWDGKARNQFSSDDKNILRYLRCKVDRF